MLYTRRDLYNYSKRKTAHRASGAPPNGTVGDPQVSQIDMTPKLCSNSPQEGDKDRQRKTGRASFRFSKRWRIAAERRRKAKIDEAGTKLLYEVSRKRSVDAIQKRKNNRKTTRKTRRSTFHTNQMLHKEQTKGMECSLPLLDTQPQDNNSNTNTKYRYACKLMTCVEY